MSDDLERRYGFAMQLSKLTDSQLVDRINVEVGNRGWTSARSYLLVCLRREIETRNVDASRIFDGLAMPLDRQVKLIDRVILPVDDKGNPI